MALGDRRVFALLTMLFPHLESRDGADIDHVFPKSKFTPDRLRKACVAEDQIESFRDRCNRLENLQLLDRTVNNEKRATLPANWLDVHCPNVKSRQTYMDRHMLGEVPGKITGFEDYYLRRRERLHDQISSIVNAV